ncbi:MAG: glycosyltransferase [Candidatus Nealsonbacteria bacterium]
MKLSIIIPTLNEEKQVPLLLESIKKQNFNDYEIIVADANSKDKTISIVKKYNCKITAGGLPSKGRNNGAKIAKGDLLLFLDADVILPKDFIKKTLKEFDKRKLKIASFFLIPQEKNKITRFFFNFFYNWPVFFFQQVIAHGAMGILIDKDIFNSIKGFDEKIKLSEDHDLIRRAKRLGKFGIIKSSKIFISTRRFQTDGWFKTYFKFILCEFHMIFIGPVKKDIFKYKFDHYSQDKKN